MTGLKKDRTSTHKAIAPIISILLMVAIAVVGGILIFIFTQGFFQDEDAGGGITSDKLVILGYDASDTDNLIAAGGNTMVNVNADETPDGKLADGDMLILYVENVGDDIVNVKTVDVFGASHTLDPNLVAGVSTCYTDVTFGELDNGSFGISESSSQLCTVRESIEPGDTVGIYINYDPPSGLEPKVGRTFPVKIISENGVASANIISGNQKGT